MNMIQDIGQTVSANTIGSSGNLLFSSSATVNGAMVTNHHATKTLFVKLTNSFSVAPTISSTNHNVPIPPASMVKLRYNGSSIAVWVASDGTTIPYTATEIK